MGYILLVDDDKWYAESVANMLNDYEIIMVETPEEAIRQIDENIPDMIYLDLNLGVKNGMTLLNELQSYVDTREIPVVILSADGKRLNQKDWEKYNVVAVLDKAEVTPEMLQPTRHYWVYPGNPVNSRMDPRDKPEDDAKIGADGDSATEVK